MEMGTMKLTMEEAKDKGSEQEYRAMDQNHFEEPSERNACDKFAKTEKNPSRRKLFRYDDGFGCRNRYGADCSATAVDVPIDLSSKSSFVSTANIRTVDRQSSLKDEKMEDSFDEPLNLSVNCKSSSDCPRIWRSCPRLSASSSTSGGDNPELLQKRVRLEEMVSYIRRCSNYVDGQPEEEEDEEDVHETQVVPVKRSFSYSQLDVLNGSLHHHHHQKKPIKGAPQIPLKKPKKPLFKEQLVRSASERNISGSDTSYPVLRQQLLAVDAVVAEHSNSFPTGVACTKEVIEEDLENDGDDEEEDEDGIMDKDDVDGHDKMSNGEFLRHQLRVLSSGSPTGSCLPWSAYAYYANLLQELQGSLHSSSNTAPSPILPISLPLPLSLSTATRSNSPLSDSGSIPVATLADGNGSATTFRKRAPRALTGKHVKHGTGASPATLLTLRQKIEQRREGGQPNNHHNLSMKHDRKEHQHKTSKLNCVLTPRKKITS